MLDFLKNILIYSLLLPGIVSLLLMAFGSSFGRKGSFFLSTVVLGFSFLIIFFNFIFWIIPGSFITYKYFVWIQIGYFHVQWGFIFDSLTSIMLLVVSFISFLVHLYSISYMYNDPHSIRFMSFLSLFTFFMFLLISGDNFLQLFLGWEGVGLCSYLLVSFWYTRIAANKAAVKALVINRVGDIALLLGMGLIYQQFKSLNYSILFSLCYYFQDITFCYFNKDIPVLTIIGFFLFIGAIGKSAQLGLHTWLPDAMEGPTPVSALIHAATMVTAGVFLLIRCSPLFEYTPSVLVGVSVIGALTSFFAASVGLVQTDVKKIIAYSTCSQLGYMLLACGLSNYMFALYHLVTHAFFKALLFLAAGSIIHAVNDEQDYRKMGGFQSFLPITYSTMVIGSFTIMGFPYLSGYYSKDLIIESNFLHNNVVNAFLQPLLLISTVFTIIYSLKLLYHVFLTMPNGPKCNYTQIHEPGVFSFLLLPLIILSICSIFSGFVLQECFTVVGNTFFNQVIFTDRIITEMEFIDFDMKLELLFITGFFVLVNFFYYVMHSDTPWFIEKKIFVFTLKDFFLKAQRFTTKSSIRGSDNFGLKKNKTKPAINIWFKFYILKLVLLPLYIQHKIFSSQINSVCISGKYFILQKEVELIFNRSLLNYKYPKYEDQSIFFNFDLIGCVAYILSGIYLKELQKFLSNYYQAVNKELNIDTNVYIILPAVIQPFLRVGYNAIRNYFQPNLLRIDSNKPLINIWLASYIVRLILFPMYIRYRFLGAPVYSVKIKNKYYFDENLIKLIFDRSLWHYKYPEHQNSTIFFNFNYLMFWDLDFPFWLQFTDSWIYCIEANFFLLFRYIKKIISDLTNVSMVEIKFYKNSFQKIQMPIGLELQNPIPLNVKVGLLTKETLLTLILLQNKSNQINEKDVFQLIEIAKADLFTLLKFLLSFDLTKPAINIWFKFYILKLVLFPLYIQHKIFSSQIKSVCISGKYFILQKEVELIFNRSLLNYKYPKYEDQSIFFNLNIGVNPSQLLQLYYFLCYLVKTQYFSVVCRLKKDQARPIINIWWNFYILKVVLLPVYLQDKFFSRTLTAIFIDQQYFITKKEVELIFNRSVLNYKYPKYEDQPIFFNLNKPSSDLIRVFFHIIYFFYRYLLFMFATTMLWSSLLYFIYFFVCNIYFKIIQIINKLKIKIMNWHLFHIIAYLNSKNRVLLIIQYFFEHMESLYLVIYNYLSFLFLVKNVSYQNILFFYNRVNNIFFTYLFKRNFLIANYIYIFNFLFKKWYFDIFQNLIMHYLLNKIYFFLYSLFEKGLFEMFGPHGLTRLTFRLSEFITQLHKNKISFFSGIMFYFVILFIFLVCYFS